MDILLKLCESGLGTGLFLEQRLLFDLVGIHDVDAMDEHRCVTRKVGGREMFSVALKVECGKYAELEHASTPQGLWSLVFGGAWAWGMTIEFGRGRECGVSSEAQSSLDDRRSTRMFRDRAHIASINHYFHLAHIYLY